MKTALKVIAAGAAVAAFAAPIPAVSQGLPTMYQCSDFLNTIGVTGSARNLLEAEVCDEGVMEGQYLAEDICDGYLYDVWYSVVTESGWTNPQRDLFEGWFYDLCNLNGPA